MGIHQGDAILYAGMPLGKAKTAMVMLHGRGGTAEDIASLADEFSELDCTYIVPQASGQTWYPNRFMEPVARNEPYLSSALELVADLMKQIAQAGVTPEKVFLLGFSQGACLALEYAARNAHRYGGIFALSGGLIGDTLTPERYQGNFEATPIFLGCSDIDPHIPLARVQESSHVLHKLGATVTERIYPRMGHAVNQDEIEFVRTLLKPA